MGNIWQWLSSSTVRQATDLRKQVEKLLNAQRDILSPAAIEALETGVAELRAALDRHPDSKALQEQMSRLESVANKWLKRYPHAGMRENIEVILVAVAIALAIRTFFLQPFKIPTGSMQPTLYGITEEDLRQDPTATLPSGFKRWFESWFYGTSYYHVVAESDGELRAIEPRKRLFPLVTRQRLLVGHQWYTIWFPPDNLTGRASLREGQFFSAGEDIVKLRVTSGDHLFVDRLTYNFRRPTRGEIIVFKTEGIPTLPPDQFYIKRLVAMDGERVQIGDDHHLIIDGHRLDASTPRFEHVYTFDPDRRDLGYLGHANAQTARRFSQFVLAPLFPDESVSYQVGRKRYLVMGDHTLNSRDSREWGDFPQANVIGKSCFVYWPISSRFGWSHR